MSESTSISDSKKEACKTYIEQTKLLVTLASAFLFAPVALIGRLKDKSAIGLTNSQFYLFIAADVSFIFSVLAGYIVLATLTGSQDSGEFNVYRAATRCFSLIQIASYLLGLIVFIKLALVFAT